MGRCVLFKQKTAYEMRISDWSSDVCSSDLGVGRNLSYKRSRFFRHKGFASHLHLRSGDDDLFVNRAASKENTRIVYQKQAQTLSEPESAWGDYLRQKRRHQSVGKYYKGWHKFLLSLPAIATVLFYASFFVLLAMQWNPGVLWATAGLKWLIQYIVFRPVMKKTGAGDLWLLLPRSEEHTSELQSLM